MFDYNFSITSFTKMNRLQRRAGWLYLIVMAVVAVCIAVPAGAQTTWLVDDDGPGDPAPGDPSVSDPEEDGSAAHPFDAIQEAIDVAVGGDTVLVADGTYTGEGNKNLDFVGKAIAVRSASGDPELCVIDCEDDGRGFYFYSGEWTDSIIEGLTVANGYAGDISGGYYGGGIYCDDSSPSIISCIIRNNTAHFEGGGIACHGSRAIISNSTIRGNSTHYEGGGLYAAYQDPEVSNCLIIGNTAKRGGGVFGYSGGNPILINCTICDNAAVEEGGGVYGSSGSNATLTNCILWDNTPQELYSVSDSHVATYCDIQGGWPGAGNIDAEPLFAFTDDYHLSYDSPCVDAGTNAVVEGLPACDFDGNARRLDGDGDAVVVVDMGIFEFNATAPSIALSPAKCTFFASLGDDNPPDQTLLLRNAGGGTLNWEITGQPTWLTVLPSSGASNGETNQVTLHVDSGNLSHGLHTAVLEVADLLAVNSPRRVIVALHVTSTFYVPSEYPAIQEAIDASIDGDIVEIADGTYVGEGNYNLDFGGKAITVRSASNNPALCIIDCAGDGRGLFFHNREGPDSVVEGLTITNGRADSNGGGVCCQDSNPMLVNCVIRGNAAVHGGGLYSEYCSPTLVNCSINDNVANSGGGVFCRESNLVLMNCVIGCNMANGGGGIYCRESNSMLTNCTISGNLAYYYGSGVFCYDSSPTLTNCILWGDTPLEVDVYSLSSPVATYCNVQGGWSGEGNIDADPQFAFAGDFHLMPGSPCIDAGTNDPPDGLPADDMDGNSRPLDGNGDTGAIADMGAFEFNPAAPSIALNPTEFEFFAPEGGDNPNVQTMSIRNSGPDTLNWEITGQPAWLAVSPASGDSSGETDQVTISLDISGLPYGVYMAVLEVTDSQAVNSPRDVFVTLYVTTTLHVPGEYPTIQAAIDAALPGDVVEIADGTYTGDGNKNLDFGGKPLTVRSASVDPELCIIDCEGDGRGFYFHSWEGPDSIVEGLTITNGNMVGSDESGGGVYCQDSSPTFRSCMIMNNHAAYREGGGVYCEGGAPTFTACLIASNGCWDSGGGVFSAAWGGLYEQCIIRDNTANGDGGGVFCGGSDTVFRDCEIENNTSTDGGGGGMVVSYCHATVQSCTFTGNSAWSMGGGLLLSEDNAVVIDCTIRDCTVTGEEWSGLLFGGGGIMCNESEAAIVDCLFENNQTTEVNIHGGGACCYRDDARFTQCVFRGNVTRGKGGGLFAERSQLFCDNCLFVDNSAGHDGGGISYDRYSHTNLHSSTVANNVSGAGGGGIHGFGFSCDLLLRNTVLWGNTCVGDGQQIGLVHVRTLDVSFCDIEGGLDDIENLEGSGESIIWGQGNIVADPLFVDPENGDYRLAVGSPCIDAGCNCAVPDDWADLDGDGILSEYLPFDLEGEGRFFDDPDTPDTGNGLPPIVDMGAYEFGGSDLPPCKGDLDGDFEIGIADLAVLLAYYGDSGVGGAEGDMDCDGDVDIADLAELLGVYGDVCP